MSEIQYRHKVRWPDEKAGRAQDVCMKLFFVLIFLVLFVRSAAAVKTKRTTAGGKRRNRKKFETNC